MRLLLIVGLGGGLGSIFRYSMQVLVSRQFPILFPLGTLLVNISGCLLIGIFYALAERASWMNPEWKFFLITGICGGYTTFSSFSYESLSLFRHGDYFFFVLYITLSVLLGLLATFGGYWLFK